MLTLGSRHIMLLLRRLSLFRSKPERSQWNVWPDQYGA
jgi:hypothetical protein